MASSPQHHANAAVTEKDAEIVLPPPSVSNPVPTLPAALRLDNREQLEAVLESGPLGGLIESRRQLLVFGSESLRTLLLRQVLTDPKTRTYKGKKNWEPQNVFPLPKNFGIVGTRILSSSHKGGENVSSRVKTSTETSHDAAEVSLVECAVTHTDYMEDEPMPDVDVVTYFIRSSPLEQTQQAASKIASWNATSHAHHRIYYLPQPTAMCHKILSNLGLVVPDNNISIHRLQLDIFPLETDVLSLEIPDALREVDVECTPSNTVTTIARALLKLQDVTGKIPRIQSMGIVAEEVVRVLLDMTVDEYMDSQAGANSVDTAALSSDSGGDITALFVLDRKVDMVTPMMTPLTYEGLLDDVVGVDCGFIHVDVSIINPDDDEAKGSVKADKEIAALPVHGSDTLYAEVRNQHVEKFGSFLQNQAKALRESHAEFTDKGKKKDLSEIHQFVKQIPVFTQNLRQEKQMLYSLQQLQKYTCLLLTILVVCCAGH